MMIRSNSQGAPLRAFAVCALLLAAVLPTVTAQGSGLAPGERVFTPVGQLERLPADALKALGPTFSDSFNGTVPGTVGQIIVLPEVRQLWQFYPYVQQGKIRTGVSVRNLDSMRLVHTIDLDVPLRFGSFYAKADVMHAVDPGRRLFLVSEFPQTLLQFDLRTFKLRVTPLSATGDQQAEGTIDGLTYSWLGDAVYLLSTQEVQLNARWTLRRLNLRTGLREGPRVLRSCDFKAYNRSGSAQAAIKIWGGNLYIPCSRGADSGIVIRLPLGEALSPNSTEDFAVGPVNLSTVLDDPATGRLYLITTAGAVWAFDSTTMTFLGVVVTGEDSPNEQELGYGLDERSGRLFALGDFNGLGVVEGRYFPVPQARTERRLAAVGSARIYTDWVSGRLFVLAGGSSRSTVSAAPAYTIYRLPAAAAPPAAPDPDASTVDQPERKGMTDSTFTGSASGYGTRVLLANGAVAAAPFPPLGGNNQAADLFVKNLRSACWFTDRELLVGRVTKTEADAGSTAAAAIAADIDARSKQDLERPSRCDVSVYDHNQQQVLKGIFATAPALAGAVDNAPKAEPRWNREPATCTSGSAARPITDSGEDHGSVPLGASQVSCAVPDGQRSVTARAHGSLVGAVSVGRAVSSTEIRRGAQGLEVTATSVASDIELGGVVRIGEVRSIARSVVNGRPARTPRSTLEVQIRGVSVAGQSLCGSSCDEASVIKTLNSYSGGRVEFRGGADAADGRLVRGTPRGALTGVQKSAERQSSDQALQGDFTVEVPGLQMIVFNDNAQWGRARQVFQFAGVATSANYNVLLLPTGSGPVDRPGRDVGLPAVRGADRVSDGLPAPDTAAPADHTPPSTEGSGPVANLVAAIGRGLRLVWGEPRQALLLFTAWLLFGLPILLARRRRLLHSVAV